MKDYTIQQGETLRLTVTVTEEGADTAEIYAENSQGVVIQNIQPFNDMVADLTTTTDTDQAPGEYPYYIKITWQDGSVDILTKKADCSGEDCDMPIITVCEINQGS